MVRFRIIGPHREDLQWGMLTAAVMNQWASGEGVRPADVMPYYDEFEEDISEEEFHRRVLSAFGG